MVLTVKHKFSIYRRFEVDIWGLGLTAAASTLEGMYKDKYLRFFFKLHKLYNTRQFFSRKKKRPFVYIIEKRPLFFFRRRKKWNVRFVSVRLTRLYFLTLRDYHFRKYFRKASKLAGNTEINYCRFIEGRIISIFYRTNYLNNIFHIFRFVKDGNIFINFKRISYVNTLVPLGAFITVNKKYKKRLNSNLQVRLSSRAVLFKVPSFLFISYRCFFFIYWNILV